MAKGETMTQLVSTTPGLYPLPDGAKTDLKRQKGNQKEDLISGEEGESLQQAYQETRAEVIGWQEEAGLDRIVEGQPRWDDMLAHPLVVHDNVETKGIVRYYNNNNFYREPVVTGELTPDGDVAAELEQAQGLTDQPVQAVLPGPYSLADLATDEYYEDESEFLDAIADFLAGEVAGFPDVETLFLLEPSLIVNPPEDERAADVPRAIDRIVDGTGTETETDVVVHTYWGSIEENVYAHVLDAAIDAIGFDLVSSADESVYLAQEYGTPPQVALGLIDGQNTRVEPTEIIRDRIDWFQEQTPVNEYETIYATTNTEPFYLPVNRLREKLAALAGATKVEVTA